MDGDKISCDNDLADVGDPCQTENDYACTSDKLMALKCVAKKFQPLSSCRGKDGCRVAELPEEKKTDFICDDSLAQDNDACDTEGEEACGMDKTALYLCKSKHFSKDRACSAGCSFDEKGERFVCATEAPAKAVATKPAKAVKASAKAVAPAKKAASVARTSKAIH